MLGSGLRPQPGLNAALQRSADVAESQRWASGGWCRLQAETDGNGLSWWICAPVSVPLPGLNQAGSQPVSVSVSGNGERIAFVRTRDGRTELMLYRRGAAALQRVPVEPTGVPRQVSLDGEGKRLAVQVSREGRWDVDVIRLP